MEETQHDGELAMQLKKISEHLVFLEKKIDQLLDARREQRPSFGSKPFGQKPYGGPNRYGSGRPQGSHQGRTRTAFYEGGGRPSGAPPRRQGGHFQKKFTPHHGQRTS